jgi:hypothetical protein
MALRVLLFIVGLTVAVLAALIPSGVLPWIVGGTGILTGLVVSREPIRPLVISTVLVVSLSAIREQFFNPSWLTNVVFFVRVYVAHIGLAAGLLGALVPRVGGEPRLPA